VLDFRLLGPVEVWTDDRRVALGGAASGKVRCILAVLLRTPGAIVPTDALIDRVWNERQPGPAVRYKYVGWLRSTLAPHDVVIAHRDGGYVLEVDDQQVDLHRFRSLMFQARQAERTDSIGEMSRLVGEALRQWRGPALSGLPGAWADLFRDQLEREHRAARVLQARCAIALGLCAQAIDQLDEWETEYPTDEEVIGLRMIGLYGCGQHAEALATYERARRRLLDFLGTNPGHSLRAIHQRILDRDPALVARTPAIQERLR
jgi:DNA-binding SARP family transcriptional activator